MAEEKSLEEILSDAKALRRTADELIKASENLMEKYERLRRRTGDNYKAFADRARDFSDGAKGFLPSSGRSPSSPVSRKQKGSASKTYRHVQLGSLNGRRYEGH
jgi:hypothetical protein